MKRSKFSEHQIIGIFKAVEAGRTVKDVCREHEISEATYYQWKSKYGGMQASDIKRLRELEDEKSDFLAFLYQLCSNIEEPIQKRKRGGQRLPLADVLFAVTFKVYSGMSARRFASDMRDALAKGYVSKLPSFNSIFDYLQNESLTPYLKYLITESALPLKSIE